VTPLLQEYSLRARQQHDTSAIEKFTPVPDLRYIIAADCPRGSRRAPSRGQPVGVGGVHAQQGAVGRGTGVIIAAA
jgi:hypothetical protein